MQCPKCGGAMWDNRTSKRKPTQPDYKCKNRECDGAVWPDKNAAPSNGNGHAAPPPNNGQSMPHAVLYKYCVQYAVKEIMPLLSGDASDSDVLAAAATLFIQASRGGTTFAPKAPAARPSPPPPPPAPVGPWDGDDDPDYLPF